MLYLRLPKIKAWIDENNTGDPLIPFSVALEERLAQLPDDEARAEEEKNIGATSGLGKITTAGYASLDVGFFIYPHWPYFEHLRVRSLKLIRYFTCGPDEVRAWTIRKGTKAPQAAGVIQWVIRAEFTSALVLMRRSQPALTLRISSSAVKS